MGKYFGTDGFRGEANVNLTVEHAYKVGRFLGWFYGKNHESCITCRPYSAGTFIDCACGAPQVGIVMKCPSPATIHRFCRFLSGDAYIFHHFKKRLVTFTQIGYFRRPIVHFYIYVCRIFAVPCRILSCIRIPYTLQISRLLSRLRAGYQ